MSSIAKENVRIGLSSEVRKEAAEVLSRILGDQHVLYLKTRNFHWNLKGFRFRTLHAFFEEQYEELAKSIDETAERIRMVGAVSPGSMAEMLELATLKEESGKLIDGEDALRSLLADHEAVVRSLRKAIEVLEDKCKDVGTADFVTGLIQQHEKLAWMLRSYLE